MHLVLHTAWSLTVERCPPMALDIPGSGKMAQLTGLEKHVSFYMYCAAELCSLCTAVVKSPRKPRGHVCLNGISLPTTARC
jgi:hypothetical protein